MADITMFMNSDHAYIDGLWGEFLGERSDAERAAQLFKIFKEHIERHIKLEDEYLFPALEKHLGFQGELGPTALAVEQHKNIIKLVGLVDEAGKTKALEKIIFAGNNLRSALAAHRETENEIHYPVSDFFIKDDEWEKMKQEVYWDLL